MNWTGILADVIAIVLGGIALWVLGMAWSAITATSAEPGSTAGLGGSIGTGVLK